MRVKIAGKVSDYAPILASAPEIASRLSWYATVADANRKGQPLVEGYKLLDAKGEKRANTFEGSNPASADFAGVLDIPDGSPTDLVVAIGIKGFKGARQEFKLADMIAAQAPKVRKPSGKPAEGGTERSLVELLKAAKALGYTQDDLRGISKADLLEIVG